MPDKSRHPGYEKLPMGRRRFLGRVAKAASLAGAAGYVALAPTGWPLARHDPIGLRSRPKERHFELPDFRVERKAGIAADVAVARRGDLEAKLRAALDALGGLDHYIKPGDLVLLKPNVAFDRPPVLGATTDPELLAQLIRLLLVDCRAAEVRVADNPIESPADCFQKSGIRKAAEKAGGRIYLPDANAFELLATPGARLIPSWRFFSRPFRGVTKVIGVAPVKDHNLCRASMGLKNWYGLLGGKRNRFHQRIHDVVSDFSLMIQPTLTILDGRRVLMRGGPTGGDPSFVKRGDAIVATLDPIAADAWAYRNLLERTDDLPRYLELAERNGGGKRDYEGRIADPA